MVRARVHRRSQVGKLGLDAPPVNPAFGPVRSLRLGVALGILWVGPRPSAWALVAFLGPAIATFGDKRMGM